jgi:uncharacterized protein (TIGR02466 family)
MSIEYCFGVPIYYDWIDSTKEQKDKLTKFFYKYTQEFGYFLDTSLNITGDKTGHHQISEQEEFKWINTYLYDHVTRYLIDIGVDVSKHKIYIQKSWPVVCDTEGAVAPHNHRNAHLSAVYYLRCDPDNGGDIIFMCPPDHSLKKLPVTIDKLNRIYSPTENQLLIFPSSLDHKVTEFTGNDFRFSISYDIMITSKDKTDWDSEHYVSDPTMWVSLGD